MNRHRSRLEMAELHDEFITRAHAEYLARTIPGARSIFLPGVTHFAPLQRPAQFNDVMLAFLAELRESAG